MTTPDIAGLCERLRRLRSIPSNPLARSGFGQLVNPDGREAADTLERQAAERDALRLAILGGEDVPGVAATVSIDQCIRFLTEERQRNEWSAEQQAKLERQAAEIEMLRDKVEGLESDLRCAVQVAYNRGATEWARLNYPDMIEWLESCAEARAALTGEDHDDG
jgi:hypothetical protein